MDLDHFGNLNPHPHEIKSESGSESTSNKNQDPDLHQSDKLDLEPDLDLHQFADDKPKCIEYEHFIKGLRLHLEARIWIQIRSTVQSQIGSASVSNKNPDLYSDPYEKN